MTMSTTVEKLEGLKRRLQITVPAEQVDRAYQSRLSKVAQTAKIDGFRPGKVPFAVVEKRYGQNILLEVAQELVNQTIGDAVKEHALAVAGQPTVVPSQIKKGEPLIYTAEFEVYPEVELADLSAEAIERHTVEVTVDDTDEMTEMLRKQRATWQPVERPVASGDRLKIDFKGFIDDVPFEGGEATDFSIEIGSKQSIPGFEEGLIGFAVDAPGKIECTFPEDYGVEALAGKPAHFDVTVKSIEEPVIPALDDAFAKDLGFEDVAALKEDVVKNIKMHMDQALKDRLKKQVMDRLTALHPLDIPDAMIHVEIANLKKLAAEQAKRMGHTLQEQVDADYKDKAKTRVTLGLLLAEVIKKFEIKVEPADVRARVESIASAYGGETSKIVEWYYNNQQMLSEVESVVLEDQAVDRILADMQVEDKTISYDQAKELVDEK